MSFLAIGSVTNALAQLLLKKLNKPPLLGNTFTVRVSTLPPDDDRVSEDTGVNLFLYRVAEHPFLRNVPWRGDRANPTGSNRTPLTLSLNYLMTAYAKRVANSTFDDVTAHQLLGNAMTIFNEYPVINDIHDGDFDADLDAVFPAELRNAFEKVKITMLPISMDEFSKIWTGLTKAYRLSVAYEVSLVQTGPLAPSMLPAAAVVRPFVQALPIAGPIVDVIQPDSGPVGTSVRITGSGLAAPGRTTFVTIGGLTITTAALTSVGENEIALTIPATLPRGPSADVTVTVGESSSSAVSFFVTPWIPSLVPLRGNSGLPVTIPFELPAGATVNADVAGQVVTPSVDAEQRTVRLVIPAGLTANGPTAVSLVVTQGAVVRRTNAIPYEVLPFVSSFTAANVGNPARTQVQVQGERLSGADVNLRFGKLLVRLGTNANASTVTVPFDRQLASLAGPVSVIVDGRESNVLPRVLTRIEPSSAGAGEFVTLVGASLSGRAVVVHFGGVDITVGAQPFSNRFEVRVPPTLAAGPLVVSVTADGGTTGTVPFTVVP